MTKARLGRTELTVNKDGFGALPVQRRSVEDAVRILKKALDGGIDFFDTARSYSDSEEKLGIALSGRRGEYILATKTPARTGDGVVSDLETSLRMLKTDHIDIFQFHNPPFCPKPGDGTGMYEALLKAKEQGKVRFIGITSHREFVAREAVQSGLYATLQFPFSYIAGEPEHEMVRLCAQKDVGFIAMKALGGGLITDIAAARAWLKRYENAVPIWGIQHESELDQLLALQDLPAVLTDGQLEMIERDRAELSAEFCRGCGYCMPCPAGIQINMCARMSLLLRRAPVKNFTTDLWRTEMSKIENCTGCGACSAACPYGLDTPELLRRNLEDYKGFTQC